MFDNLFRLDGKVAVVTGAGNGLGRSFSLGLAAFGLALLGRHEISERTTGNAAKVNCPELVKVPPLCVTVPPTSRKVDVATSRPLDNT